ncbi:MULTISPECIES: exodeoxyribonuclease V subunit beta [Halorussus]|uniref:UvrD-helicase domain-containing protein n=1 Tax=Halorussus TaxID=1070314 RepID=UPI000E211B7A|nr:MULTISPECIES: UvrD-helicase domain-containing protein [Halorussus]NHN60453.1 UvrD-helicase domain-containing protein [Halorussus sp. JP-T4]
MSSEEQEVSAYAEEMELEFGNRGEPPFRPTPDQGEVIRSYFEESGRVAVDASAGTGKTTTLILTLAEMVVREASSDYNPLENTLVTTFTKDATKELKTRLKRILRLHGDVPPHVFRWIETGSHIQTLDSFFKELLQEISIDLNIPPDFELDSAVELQQIREEIFEELRRTNREEFETLSQEFPTEDWREYSPDTVEEMIQQAQQKCREFGISPDEAISQLRASLDVSHGVAHPDWPDDGDSLAPLTNGPDTAPPDDIDDVEQLLQAVVNPGAELRFDSRLNDDEREQRQQMLLEHVRDTYFRTEEAIEAFGTLLNEFEQRYDERTRGEGQFSFQDISHLLRNHIQSQGEDDPFVQSLGSRFDHVFVDEFQDTSIVQCEIIRHLVDSGCDESILTGESEDDPDETGDDNILMIGDVKQSIYEWRSADPALFADIIQATRDARPGTAVVPHLFIRNVRYHALTSVFRHHPDIAYAANHVFQDVLEDDGRGAIGGIQPNYVPIQPRGDGLEWDDETAHIHVLDIDAASNDNHRSWVRTDNWARDESRRVAETIAAMVDEENADDPPIQVQRGVDEDGEPILDQPVPGDITLLFRSKRKMQDFADVLRDNYGIDAAPIATDDLFEQPEIKLLTDILYWFANPHNSGALLRILRSPLVAVSDGTLRALAFEDYYIGDLLDSWPDELPLDDKERLEHLVTLRDDLRWDRENSKTDLVNRILQHSGFDSVVLADTDALRRYGNLWLFSELIDDWEEDELLPYRDFVDRLVTLRDRADSSNPQFEVAEIADQDNDSAVTLTTVHKAKGREFPIVFLCDLVKQSRFPPEQHDRLLTSRRYGMALRPRPSDLPFPDGVHFPTPEDDLGSSTWFNDDFDVDSFPTATGPTWVSYDRDATSGQFSYSNPLNNHLAESEAEFWRMAYVGFTRAEDHIFFGLSDLDESSDYYDEVQWSMWLAALNDTLQPFGGWSNVSQRDRSDRVIDRDLRWETDQGDPVTETIRIGVDEVEPSSERTLDEIDASGLDFHLETDGMPVEHPEYRPLTLAASSLFDLIECPRAYQYQHAQEIEPVRGNGAESTSTPGDRLPDEWGESVHRSIELRLQDEALFNSYARGNEDIEDLLRHVVLDNLTDTDAFSAADRATEDDVFTEISVSTLYEISGREIRVNGDIDLLYRKDGDWHLADWKTGGHYEDGDYQHRKYIHQLSVYAWLLRREFGIEMSSATLVYIDVNGSPVVKEQEVTSDLVTGTLNRVIEEDVLGLDVQDSDGLEANPGTDRCGACPYGANKGGPCLDDALFDAGD